MADGEFLRELRGSDATPLAVSGAIAVGRSTDENHSQRVIVADNGAARRLLALDSRTGETVFRYELGDSVVHSRVSSIVALIGGDILYSDQTGNVPEVFAV